MSVLVYTESWSGSFRKSTFEAVSYASETAKLSLWLAEHQMNLHFKEVFGVSKPSLPISELGNVVCENSIKFNWEKFCELENKTEEIFLIGNPPFKGYRSRTEEQKKDVEYYFKTICFCNFWLFLYNECKCRRLIF